MVHELSRIVTLFRQALPSRRMISKIIGIRPAAGSRRGRCLALQRIYRSSIDRTEREEGFMNTRHTSRRFWKNVRKWNCQKRDGLSPEGLFVGGRKTWGRKPVTSAHLSKYVFLGGFCLKKTSVRSMFSLKRYPCMYVHRGHM